MKTVNRISGLSPIVLALVAILLAASLASEAQYPPSGQRRPRTDRPTERPGEPGPGAARAPIVPDPILAFEHELPSLKTDLNLAAEQLALWGSFERAWRDVAELSRQRTRKLLAPRPIDAPAPSAVAIAGGLADDDRLRSEAMADAAKRMHALYDALTASQRSLFDRRLLLSLSEPLGTQ